MVKAATYVAWDLPEAICLKLEISYCLHPYLFNNSFVEI